MTEKAAVGSTPAAALHHRLSDIDYLERTATCSQCGPTIIQNKGSNRWRCRMSYNHRRQRSGYRKHLKDACERCGFVPEQICQLDIDHRDGNHFNNDPANLSCLCANCHRLKTYYESLGNHSLWLQS